jgi:RNA polymerase sigma-70 factor (ECF subfamily)
MTPVPSFDDWLARIRARDETAAGVLFARFARRLLGLARQRLDARLAGKVDPEDIVQSVLCTVCLRLGRGEFDLIDWDSLWGLLTCVTVRKCCKWRAHFLAARRDVGREQPLPAFDNGEADQALMSRDPDPAEADLLHDTLQDLLRGLNDLERQITLLRLVEGLRAVQIAEQLGCSQSKVSRVLSFVAGRLSLAARSCK